ncbi:hypothetical protein SDJN02_17886, partial [Cucurbita argyrosperma subsp. argyrosperma]
MDDSNEHKENASPSSLKAKIKSSLCLSCCLRRHRNGHHHLQRHQHQRRMSFSSDGEVPSPLTRCSSAKDKSRSRESPESKTDWRPHFISRLGRHSRRHSSASVDFHYDALSYALNFDEGYDEGHVDDAFPLRNFSSRLPASPPKSAPSSTETSREMTTAYS